MPTTIQNHTTDHQSDTLLNAALSHQKQGDLVKAESIYRKILAQNPRHFAALYNMILLASDAHKYDIALLYAEKATKIMPASAEAIAMKGNAHLGLKQYRRAIECFHRAIDINPHYTLAHYNLGVCYSLLGGYERAIRHYQETLILTPDDAEIYDALGNIYTSTGQLEEAKTSYFSALNLSPYEPKAVCHYASTLYMLGSFNSLKDFIHDAIHKSTLSGEYISYLLSIQALVEFIEDDYVDCQKTIETYEAIAESNNIDTEIHTDYESFIPRLKQLIAIRKEKRGVYSRKATATLPIFGSNQCLAFQGLTFIYRNKTTKCQYHMVPHATIMDMVGEGIEANKVAFAKQIENTTFEDKQCLLCLDIFNETRLHTYLTFLRNITKDGMLALDDYCQHLAEKYITFIKELFIEENISVSLCATPRPSALKDIEKRDKTILINLSQRFNKYLAHKAKQHGYSIIDLYASTSSEDDKLLAYQFIDSYTLHPAVLIEAQY